jgi:hypothetical protein
VSRPKRSFDKYWYYHQAVQSPERDCEVLRDIYKELRSRKNPLVLREDFCGTFAVSCQWVKSGPKRRAFGLDLDPEPIQYGLTHYASQLTPHQRRRLAIKEQSVLTASVPRVDIVVALNFSYFLFKSKLLLRQYFLRARRGLKRDGLFILDCFGGSAALAANVEKTRIGHFDYFWDQTGYNPIRNEAIFQIHFKRKGEPKREKVFSYDWRLWSIPEIRDTMIEAGFRGTHVYWEGTTRAGNGDGQFKRQETGDDADAWIAYVVGEP